MRRLGWRPHAPEAVANLQQREQNLGLPKPSALAVLRLITAGAADTRVRWVATHLAIGRLAPGPDVVRRGFSSGGAEGGALARFDFTVMGAALFAAFFAVVLAARRARCLVAKSRAFASTISSGEPSRAMRWSWQSTAWQYTGAIFQRLSTPSVYG
jgi:hypothetical protein